MISRPDLERAAAAGIIASAQVEPLWQFLAKSDTAHAPRFSVVQVLWYGGALIVMGAMSLFATLAFELMGGPALTVIGLAYATAFTVAGHALWRRGLVVPGGLLVAIAVGMVPLTVYGVQEALGWWSETPLRYRDFYVWIKSGWLPMETVTILAGIVALRCYPFPFIVMPIAVCLWFMSMDLTPWIFGEHWNNWDQRKIVSLCFGLVVLVLAWVVDVVWQRNLAFWLHLSGLLAFWGGLSLLDGGSEWSRAGYAMVNLALIALSIFLGRRAYAVFGAVGLAMYVGDIAYRVFNDSLLFPFALSLIGIAVIGLGLLFYRHEARIEAWIEHAMPSFLRQLRPAHAHS